MRSCMRAVATIAAAVAMRVQPSKLALRHEMVRQVFHDDHEENSGHDAAAADREVAHNV